MKDARDAILDSIDEAEDTRAGLALERRDSEDRMDDAETRGMRKATRLRGRGADLPGAPWEGYY